MSWIVAQADVEESARKPSLRRKQIVDSTKSNFCILESSKLLDGDYTDHALHTRCSIRLRCRLHGLHQYAFCAQLRSHSPALKELVPRYHFLILLYLVLLRNDYRNSTVLKLRSSGRQLLEYDLKARYLTYLPARPNICMISRSEYSFNPSS